MNDCVQCATMRVLFNRRDVVESLFIEGVAFCIPPDGMITSNQTVVWAFPIDNHHRNLCLASLFFESDMYLYTHVARRLFSSGELVSALVGGNADNEQQAHRSRLYSTLY